MAMQDKRDTSKILNDYYPTTRNALTRLAQLIDLVNEEVSETTRLQDSIVKLSESEHFLKNITNVVQDYVDTETSGEELSEIVKIVASSILDEVSVSKELIQALDSILVAVRDIPKDIVEAFYGLQFNTTFPNKEPQWTADPNKNPYGTVTVFPTSVATSYHNVTYTNKTKYIGNVQPAKKIPSKKPLKNNKEE